MGYKASIFKSFEIDLKFGFFLGGGGGGVCLFNNN
jgi:hypothetical protein